MPKTLLKLLWPACLLSSFVVVVAIGCEEPTDPSLHPPDVEDAAPAPTPAQSAAPTTLPLASRTPADIKKLAEGGDVDAMMLLGRSYESLGQAKQARTWYQKAVAAGSADAKKALASLDAPATRATSPSATGPFASTSTATRPVASAQPPAPSAKRIPMPPPPPGEPGKLRWIDIAAILNYDDMVTDTQVVPIDPRRAPPGSNQKSQFIAVTRSKDGGITVVATGPSETELTEVTAALRVRNKLDPGSSPRVGQAGAIAARVTSDNVNQQEIVDWITRYLQTEDRSEPIFRAGWTLMVSGAAAEGKPDAKPHLGAAVMIEMKK